MPSSFYSSFFPHKSHHHQLQRAPKAHVLPRGATRLRLDARFDHVQRAGDEPRERTGEEAAHEEGAVVLRVRVCVETHLLAGGVEDALHPVVGHHQYGGVRHVHQDGGEVRGVQRAHALRAQDRTERHEWPRVETQLHPLLHHVERRHHRVVGKRGERAGHCGCIGMEWGEE